ncbi:MAG: nucleoside triphosphate pyrophosphohydrolase [Candidatus Acidiferrales bacterium]
MTARKNKPAATRRNTKNKIEKKSPLKKRNQSARREAAGAWFEKLVRVMSRLRAPGGCPWDREQTHATLRTYLIEEAYEVLEALDGADDVKFAEELGDLLLQVVFHAQMADEEGRFTIADVIREIYEKMIRRHPHVFGEKQAKDAAEVLRNWEIIKREERQAKGAVEEETAESVLDGVPRSLPALLEGYQLTRKAARIGFDWENVGGIFEKLQEETEELRQVLEKRGGKEVEGEVGDILFAAVNLARFLKIDPEIAMKKASGKFSGRFREMERVAREHGTNLAEVPRWRMEELWEEAKKAEDGS